MKGLTTCLGRMTLVGLVVMVGIMSVWFWASVISNNQPSQAEPEANPIRETIAEAMTRSVEIEYADLARQTEQYEGEIMHGIGQVIQVREGGSYAELRVNVTKGEYGFWSDTIYVNYPQFGNNRVLEDDVIEFYAEVKGRKSYMSVLGGQITIPELDILTLTIVDAE